MFEAIVTLCLAAGAAECREVLVPGYEAETQAKCVSALSNTPPDIAALFKTFHPQARVMCQPAGIPLKFEEVAPGVFAHRGAISEPNPSNGGDVSNIGFVIGEHSVAVVDSGGARWVGEAVWRAIRARTPLPVSHILLTHMHPDHVMGASVFVNAGAKVVGHAALDRALSDRRANYLASFETLISKMRFIGTELVGTDKSVADALEIDLGARVLQLRAWPSAHTGNDLTVFDRQSGVLFAGDLVFDQHAPALDGSLRGWQAVLESLKTLPVTRVVPGHGGPILDWPADGAAMVRYLSVLARDTRAALDDGQRMGDAIKTIAQSEAPHWQLFESFNPRNATVAFTELEWD